MGNTIAAIRRVEILVCVMLALVFGEIRADEASQPANSFANRPISPTLQAIAGQLTSSTPLSVDPKQLTKIIASIDAVPVATTFVDPRVVEPIQRIDLEREVLKNRLLCDSRYHLHADGRMTQRQWTIARVIDRRDVAEMSQVTVPWSPWREDKPEIQARVITAEGVAIALRKDQIVEQLAPAKDQDVISDNRQLVAMLSGVQPGCIIEIAWTRTSQPTLPSSGCGATCTLADLDPWRLFFVRITSDPDTKWALAPIGPAVHLDVTRRTDKHCGSIDFLASDTPTLMDWFESKTGPTDSSFPLVRIAHRRSWGDLGMAYHRLVDEVIESGHAFVSTLRVEPSHVKGEQLQSAVEAIGARVRYTGWSLGELAIQPAKPDEVLMRRYGDCKDQSTLLVALLRSIGIEAHVALLRSGEGLDISPELPTISGFNHAIVAVVDPSLPSGVRFIDPTVHCDLESGPLPFGTLPASCRGRWALLCNDKPALIRTPVATAQDEIEINNRLFACNAMGVGTFGISSLVVGTDAIGFPNVGDPVNQRRLRENVVEQFKETYGSELAFAKIKVASDPSERPAFEIVKFSELCQLVDRRGSRLSFELSASDHFGEDESLAWYMPDSFFKDSAEPNIDSDPSKVDVDVDRNSDSKPATSPITKRRSPWVQTEGKTIVYRLAIRLPADMSITFDEDEFEEQLGLMQVRVQRRRTTSKNSDLDFLKEKPGIDGPAPHWVTLKNGTSHAFDGLGHPDDQCCLIECHFTLLPGVMSAESMRAARETMAEWISQDRFAFRVSAEWLSGDVAEDQPTAEQIRTLVLSNGNQPDKVAQATTVAMLGRRNLSLLANWLLDQSDLSKRLASADLTLRDMIAHERLLQSKPDQRPRVDLRSASQAVGPTLSAISPSSRILWLAGRIAAADGTLSTDSKVVGPAFRHFVDSQPDLDQSVLNDDVTRRLVILAGLAGREERTLIRLAQRNPALYDDPVVKFLMERDEPAKQPAWPSRGKHGSPAMGDERLRFGGALAVRTPNPSDRWAEASRGLTPVDQSSAPELKPIEQLDWLLDDHDLTAQSETDSFETIEFNKKACVDRTTFLVLVTCGRFDLAEKFQSRHADSIPSSLRIAPTVSNALPPLDRRDASSVVRHMIYADIMNDDSFIRSLSSSHASADAMIGLDPIRYRPTDWAPEFHCLRSRELANFIAARATVTSIEPQSPISVVLIQWPHSEQWSSGDALLDSGSVSYAKFAQWYDGNEEKLLSRGDIAFMFQCPNQSHEYSLSPANCKVGSAAPLLTHMQVAESLSVYAAISEMMESLKREHKTNELGIGTRTLNAWVRLANLPPSVHPNQVSPRSEWTMRMLVAETGDLATTIRSLVGSTEPSILEVTAALDRMPVFIVRDAEELLIEAFTQQGQLDRAISVANHRLHRTLAADDAMFLLTQVYLASLSESGKGLAVDWKSSIQKMMASDRRPEIEMQVQIYESLMRGKIDEALQLAINLRKQPSLSKPWIVRPSSLLWIAMNHRVDADRLLQVIDEVEVEVMKESDEGELHALACAKLKLAETDEAIELYAATAAEDPFAPASTLFYGMVAENLGLNQIAVRSYVSAARSDSGDPIAITANRRIDELNLTR